MENTALIDVTQSPQPVFRDRSLLTPEQLSDPDHAMKELEKINKGRYNIGTGCSKCHHCR